MAESRRSAFVRYWREHIEQYAIPEQMEADLGNLMRIAGIGDASDNPDLIVMRTFDWAASELTKALRTDDQAGISRWKAVVLAMADAWPEIIDPKLDAAANRKTLPK